MNGIADSRNEYTSRRDLVTAISMLEHLGIIDFNGHFSVRLDDGNLLINTGSSVRSAMTPHDFVIVGEHGDTDVASPRPPAELPLHVAVYQARPDVKAVVHGHPKWSTLLSTAGLDYQVTIAQGALLGEVSQYPSPRSVNNPVIAAEVADTLAGGRATLLRAHGSVVAADTILQATVLSIYLELNAERQISASALGRPYVFTPEEIQACQKGLWKQGLFEKCWNYHMAKFGLPRSS